MAQSCADNPVFGVHKENLEITKKQASGHAPNHATLMREMNADPHQVAHQLGRSVDVNLQVYAQSPGQGSSRERSLATLGIVVFNTGVLDKNRITGSHWQYRVAGVIQW